MTPPFKPLPEKDGLAGPPGSAAAMAQVLASQVGYREGSNNDNAYGLWYPMNFQPWCAIFQSWAAWHAGVSTDVIPKHAYTPSGAAWFKARGQLHTYPQAGDLGYVYYSSLGRIGHIFFVESTRMVGEAVIMTTLEGNTNDYGGSQGNGVYRLIRGDTTNLSYGRPAYVAAPAPPQVPLPSEEDEMITVLIRPGERVRVPVGNCDMAGLSHEAPGKDGAGVEIRYMVFVDATDSNEVHYKPTAWAPFYDAANRIHVPSGKASISELRPGTRTVGVRNEDTQAVLGLSLWKA